jgi:hypothetical protein
MPLDVIQMKCTHFTISFAYYLLYMSHPSILNYHKTSCKVLVMKLLLA